MLDVRVVLVFGYESSTSKQSSRNLNYQPNETHKRHHSNLTNCFLFIWISCAKPWAVHRTTDGTQGQVIEAQAFAQYLSSSYEWMETVRI